MLSTTMTTETKSSKSEVLRLYTYEPEGLWPDTALEVETFKGLPMEVVHIQGNLGAPGYGQTLKDVPDEICAKVHGLFMFRHFLDEEQINRYPNLRVVVRMGVGYDRLDRKTLAKRGVKVCNIPDYGTTEVADHAIALALTLRRGILHYHSLWLPSPLSSGTPDIPLWEPTTSNLIQRPSVRTFGILGLGRIGTAAALRAKAFGFHVIFYDPYLPNGVDRALAIERVRSLESLFERTDTLSVHVPLTPSTVGIVDEPLLRRMPPGAVVINTSRGPTLDIDALYRCLKDGTLAGAALDVLPQEPPDEPLHPLYQAYQAQEEWIRGKFVITPHAAFHSPESWQDIRALSAQCMREVLCEGLNTNVIPPESW